MRVMRDAAEEVPEHLRTAATATSGAAGASGAGAGSG